MALIFRSLNGCWMANEVPLISFYESLSVSVLFLVQISGFDWKTFRFHGNGLLYALLRLSWMIFRGFHKRIPWKIRLIAFEKSHDCNTKQKCVPEPWFTPLVWKSRALIWSAIHGHEVGGLKRPLNDVLFRMPLQVRAEFTERARKFAGQRRVLAAAVVAGDGVLVGGGGGSGTGADRRRDAGAAADGRAHGDGHQVARAPDRIHHRFVRRLRQIVAVDLPQSTKKSVKKQPIEVRNIKGMIDA